MNRRNPTVLVATTLLMFAICLTLSRQVRAAAQPPQTVAVFLEIDGVVGTSADAQHKDAIEVQSFSLAGQNEGAGAKATLADFFVLKPLDAASPKLLEALATS